MDARQVWSRKRLSLVKPSPLIGVEINITVGASYIGTARSPALKLADLMLVGLGISPFPKRRPMKRSAFPCVLAV